MNEQKIFFRTEIKKKPKLRVFCFPYAGGGINTYAQWSKYFPNDIELIYIQLPGRGSRIMDDPKDNAESVFDEILEHKELFLSTPFVFFGHSLGSRLAFGLSCRLKKIGFPGPQLLIASASGAPHIPTKRKAIHHLPRVEFISELRQLKGTPEEILKNNELMDLLLPALRADFEIANSYQESKVVQSFPLVVLQGEEDTDVSIVDVNAWRELSDADVEIISMPGDHFFVDNYSQKVAEQVISSIEKALYQNEAGYLVKSEG